MLSKTTSTPEKIKVIFMTYLITTKRYDKDNIIKDSQKKITYHKFINSDLIHFFAVVNF